MGAKGTAANNIMQRVFQKKVKQNIRPSQIFFQEYNNPVNHFHSFGTH